MAWQPQAGPLEELAQCLRDSLSGHNIAAQKKAEQVSQGGMLSATKKAYSYPLR